MDSTQVIYGKRFLKQPRDGASAMSLSRLFHWYCRRKEGVLIGCWGCCDVLGWFALVRESAGIRCEYSTATSAWAILNNRPIWFCWHRLTNASHCKPMVQAIIISVSKMWQENDKNTPTWSPNYLWHWSIFVVFNGFYRTSWPWSRELQCLGLILDKIPNVSHSVLSQSRLKRSHAHPWW